MRLIIKHETAYLSHVTMVLVALLALLAFLQYRSQGRITEAEHERMQTNRRAATNRFAEDFDRELTNIYFGLQMKSGVLESKNWAEFAQRYDVWAASASSPGISKNILLLHIEPGKPLQILNFDQSSREFETISDSNESDRGGREKILDAFRFQNDRMVSLADPFAPIIIENIPAFVAPVLPASPGAFPQRVVLPAQRPRAAKVFNVIGLDLDQIKRDLLPMLARRCFGDANATDYSFALVRRNAPASVVYNSDLSLDIGQMAKSDASADIFRIRLFGAGSPFSETAPQAVDENAVSTALPISPSYPDSNQIVVRPLAPAIEDGVWQVLVKHRMGSLEAVVQTARRRNLAIIYGVLGLMGASFTMIIITVRRAQGLARRQTEFAANISHEFRSPLAVITLAGENLSDGVVNAWSEVRSCGSLINSEAQRLSETIEQVLEISANQAGKIYLLRPLNVSKILETAIESCRRQIIESDFAVETKIMPNLPPVLGNETALSRAVQNLLTNAIKYAAPTELLNCGRILHRLCTGTRSLSPSKIKASELSLTRCTGFLSPSVAGGRQSGSKFRAAGWD